MRRLGDRYSLPNLARQLRLDPQVLMALCTDSPARYSTFNVAKPGKQPRIIDDPDRLLKFVQRRIRSVLLKPLALPKHVHGCVKGRSALSNASEHLGRSNVSSVDVKHFYPSVTNRMVFRTWRRLGFGPPLAGLLTKLVTQGGHLPQGSPTSDAVANHSMHEVDRSMVEISSALDLSPSRYLDNIEFSGDRAREAIAPIISQLIASGVPVRGRKVYNTPAQRRQVVTGYSVNNPDGPSVPRKDQLRVRAAVHQFILKHNVGQATLKDEQSLRGRLAYLRRSNPGAAARLERQLVAAGIWKPRTQRR
jgi:hypothetical protein